MSITIMFVFLMVVIVAIDIHGKVKLEMVNVMTFTTLKCAVTTKEIAVSTLKLAMAFVTTPTTTESVIMMEEIAALEILIQVVVLSVHASKSLM